MAGFPSNINRKGDKAKQPHPGIPLNKSTIAELIAQEHGNLSRIADRMGTTRTALRHVIEKDEALTVALNDSRERLIEEVERSVWTDAIETRDTALRCFVLKTQGRHRGWDQDEAKNTAKDIASAAFEFIINKSKPSQ